MDKQYLISEEEIKRTKFMFKTYRNAYDAIDDFLKSKQPVEVIAEGEFTKGAIVYEGKCTVEGVLFCGVHIEDYFEKYIYDKKKYQIIIREVKD